jgi:hypothetical protein
VLPRRWRLLLRFGFLHRGGRVVDDRADELVPAAADRSDVALRFAVVAQRPAGRLDAAGQCRLADEPSAPHRVEQFFLGDAALMVAHELGQDVEHLRLDAHHIVAVPQFVALGVEHKMVEAPQAGGPLSPAVGRPGRPHQSVAQFAQLRGLSSFFDRGRHVLRGASDLIDAIGQLGGLVGRQHHRIRRHRCALDLGALLVGTLAAGLSAVLTAPAKARVGDFTTTPPARLRASAGSGHGLHGSRL